jgi:hypothetical protein
MKDRQTTTAAAQASVPLLSPVLHWLAMPALVYLRSGFGYSFLRPKLIFIVSAYGSALFTIYAYLGKGAWERYWAVACYVAGASSLYLFHFIYCVLREARSKAEHDAYAGTSHLFRIPSFAKSSNNEGLITKLYLWGEPLLVLFVATTLRVMLNEQRLSIWLLLVVGAMWGKALINYWYGIRSAKRREDIMEDAQEGMPEQSGYQDTPLPSAGGRKPKSQRPPNVAAVPSAKELRYAEILRLMPPYDLEQAEKNYRALSETHQPHSGTATTEKSAQLIEALEYFRRAQGSS